MKWKNKENRQMREKKAMKMMTVAKIAEKHQTVILC